LAQVLDQQQVRRGIQIAIANSVGLTKGQAAGSSGSLRELPLEPESFDAGWWGCRTLRS
jgi:hypothetical protein